MDEPVRLILPLMNENQSSIDPDKLVRQLAGYECQCPPVAYGRNRRPLSDPRGVSLPQPLPCRQDGISSAKWCKKPTRAGSASCRASSGRWTKARAPMRPIPTGSNGRPTGKPNIWNGCYLTCVNGGYYQEQVFKILGEVLEKYPIDGTFFNASGQRMCDNDGNTYAPCNCDNCKRLFRAKYNRDIPEKPDAQYRNSFPRPTGPSSPGSANSSIPSVPT